MKYNDPQIAAAADILKQKIETLENKAEILRSAELKKLYSSIASLPAENRAAFGQELNSLPAELQSIVDESAAQEEKPTAIDITAPFDVNQKRKPTLLNPEVGSSHPLMRELTKILDIFYRMGFSVIESRQIDDDYHMFSALNFPIGHPARDDYDSFMTTEGLIAPAHTSTMQNRVLKEYRGNLDNGQPISVVIPGRVFRNEDLDARHEHTFYQVEGVYVDKDISVVNLITTFKTFLQEYYGQKLDVKIQPFYFPFTEPSFEFALSCPFCNKKGCTVCSFSGWIELGGCGLIHPNVLTEGGIDPQLYSGFAWGFGVERLVMMKYDIEDVRYFESARLEFLRQFK